LKSQAIAPAKVILTGEHFVVYGAPAIVSAVDIHSNTTASKRRDQRIVVKSSSPECTISIKDGRCEVLRGGEIAQSLLEPISVLAQATLQRFGDQCNGLNLHIESDIPVGVGLGSSAAVAVSAIAAIERLLRKRNDLETIRQLAFESERLIHKTPSGIDQTISTFGGIIVYRKEKPFRRINLKHTFPIIIGDTGKRRSTGEMVSKVRKLLAERDDVAKKVMGSAQTISRRALLTLRRGDRRELGELMNQNHELLRQIEVSTEDLERLVSAAREAGAFGAKLTGAGGGGCMIAVSSPNHLDDVQQAIRDSGGTPHLARIELRGVRSWLVT